MRNTAEMQDRIAELWTAFSTGKLKGQDARTHIAFARTMIEVRKVEISAAHVMGLDHIPSLPLSGPVLKVISHKKRAA